MCNKQNIDLNKISESFRLKPKIMYKKEETNDLLLQLASIEIKDFCNGKDHFKYIGDLYNRHILDHVKPFFITLSTNDLQMIVNDCSNKLTNEFHLLTFFLKNIKHIDKNDINFDFDDILEIYWCDNPDFIIKIRNKDGKNILLNIELTSFAINHSNHSIKNNIKNHLDKNKILESCNNNIFKKDTFNFKIYLILFCAKDFNDKLIYFVNDQKHVPEAKRKILEETIEQNYPKDINNGWKIIARAF